MKSTSLPYYTFDPNLSAHKLDQSSGDGQPQASTAVLARRRAIGLRERLEDSLLLLCRNPNARIGDGEVEADLVLRLRRRLSAHHHLTLLGELDGIPHHISQDLAQASHITHQGIRNLWEHIAPQFQPFLVGGGNKHPHYFSKACAQRESSRIESELTRLDL